MKIMITGSCGQLGNELQSILKSGKSEIGAMPEELSGAEIIPADIDELDIADNAAVMAFVKECKPDVIINCAAMTNVDGCESDYETAFKVNAMGVRNLAMAAKENGAKLSVKKFVRFETGEGIEKKVDDFAAEVAAQAGL